MPTPTKGPRLGGGPAHERLILANLATSLFEHDSITTTEAKAKRLRPLAERLVTFAKRGDLHARRRVMTVGPRKGDNAPMAVIELVREPVAKKAVVKSGPSSAGEAAAATKRASKDAEKAKAAEVTEAEELTLDDNATDEAAAAPAGLVELPEGAAATTEDGTAPEGHDVKGNADSGLYHVPGSQWYDATEAEFWFASAEDAEKAGFKPAGGAAKQKAEDDEA